MIPSEVRFSAFERVLQEFGFHRTPTEGTQVFLQHAMPDTWILLPEYHPDDLVRSVHLISARRLLVERGLAEERQFDTALSEAMQTTEQAA